MANKFFNDGGVLFGTLRVTIPNGEQCIAEEFNLEEPSSSNWVRDEFNAPAAAVHTAEPRTGTMILRLPRAATAIPQRFDVFIVQDDVTGELSYFTILKVGKPRKQGEVRKFPLDIAEVLNPSNYAVT